MQSTGPRPPGGTAARARLLGEVRAVLRQAYSTPPGRVRRARGSRRISRPDARLRANAIGKKTCEGKKSREKKKK